MIRVANVEIPEKKPIGVALTYIYGIGASRARKILVDATVDYGTRANTLSEKQLTVIRRLVSKYVTEGNLRRVVTLNIKRLVDIGTYRGMRHVRCLPVRGQSSKQNARTCKKRKSYKLGKKSIAVRKRTPKKK